jgi:preprotein translocase subunit SecF
MTPLQQKQKAGRQILAPVLVLLLLSIPVGLAFASGGFPAGEEFRSGTLIQFVSGSPSATADTVEQAVEATINQDVKVTQNNNLFQVEVPSAMDNASISSLKNGLALRGMWDNTHTFTSDVFGPSVSAAGVQSIILATVGALIVIAILVLVLFRRRAAVFYMPLVAGVDVLEVLGIMALLNFPLSIASLAGVLSVLVYSVNTNVFLACRMLRGTSVWSKEQLRRTIMSGAEMGLATAALYLLVGVFTLNAQALEFVVIFLAGAGLNLFNTRFLGTEVLTRWGKKHLEVAQHVAP